MEFFKRLFESDFMPHGHCYFWKPAVLWSNVLGDAVITLSYFIIPFLLLRFLRKRSDVKFRWVFSAFAAFILACGLTHLIAIISVWHPMYRLEGLMKVITAIISAGTVGALFYLFPVILKIPTPEAWQAAKDDLLQSEQRFKLMMQNAPIGMAITSVDGRFQEVNDAMCKLFKYGKEEFKKLGFQDITHPDFLQSSQQQTDQLSSGDLEVIQMEKQYVRSDGSTFWAIVNVASMRSEKMNIVQIVDISDRKKYEGEMRELNRNLEAQVDDRTKELAESHKDLENFIYAVTHDLRVPMHNLEGLTTVVQEELADLEGKEDAKEAISMINENARRMDALVVDLLAFSRAGQQEISKTPIDIGKKMMDVLEELRPKYAHKKIDLTIHELPPVRGDKAAIGQVCQNLISNSLKYSSLKDNIRIEVGGEIKDGQAVFWVKDNGVGFDQQYASKLFSLFSRLHTTEEFEGTGLGLAASSRLIQKHGGEMWAEGVPGEGATFYFSLPA